MTNSSARLCSILRQTSLMLLQGTDICLCKRLPESSLGFAGANMDQEEISTTFSDSPPKSRNSHMFSFR